MAISQADRARMIVRWLSDQTNKNMREIGVELGYDNPSYFSQLLNGKKNIPFSLLEKLAALDPRINLDFLKGESEEMLLPGNVQPRPDLISVPASAKKTGVFLPNELVQMFSDLSAAVRSQQETIAALVKSSLKE